MTRRVVLGTLVALAAVPASASAQALPPSLALDTSYAFSGFSEYDFTIGSVSADDATSAATDPARGRLYAAGATAGATGLDVAVVARRTDGTLDPSFAGDGSLTRAVSAGDDRATDVAVLPDGRLRVLVEADTGVPGSPDPDVAILGLAPDGTPDPGWGTDGVVTFAAGAAGAADVPTRLDVDAAGRIAVTGATGTGAAQSTFVAVREADGSAAAFGTGGARVIDRNAAAADGGEDVVWTPSGLAVLIQLGTGAAEIQTLTPAGADDVRVPVDAGGTATTAGGLELAAGALWATGSTVVDADTDAYLFKAGLDGASAPARRFDLRGAAFPATQQVDSSGLDLTLVSGEPDTLVVGGATTTDAGTEPAAAAFNELTRPAADLQATDLVVPVEGQGSVVGVAAGAGGEVAATAALLDFSVETGSGTNDTGIGMGRLVVDREKRCDLSLTITTPLELRLSGRNPGLVGLRVANVGQRACAGTITAGAPFTLGAPLATGKVFPGQAVALAPAVAYTAAALPEKAQLTVAMDTPGDAGPGDNSATLGVRFAYCDLRLRTFRPPAYVSTEGTSAVAFSVRNLGTAACSTAGLIAGAPAVRTDKASRYAVPAGQSVTDEVQLRLGRATRPGRRVRISFRAPASTDVSPADNVTALSVVPVRPGDTDVRTPRDRRTFTGRARSGRAPGQRARTLRVRRVEVAVRKLGKGCAWLANGRGRFRRGATDAAGSCSTPTWVKARGTSRWTLKLRRKLGKGRYLVQSRAVLRNGVAEQRFTASDRNRRTFRVR